MTLIFQWNKLSILDDLRSDFFLTPLIWLFRTDSGINGESNPVQKLISRIQSANHLILNYKDVIPSEWPRLWVPTIFVDIIHAPDQSRKPPNNLPQNTFKVLLSLSNTNLNIEVNQAWELCISFPQPMESPKLKYNDQSWLSISSIQELFTAIASRCRVSHLKKIEQFITDPPLTECKASVIICTYHRANLIYQALLSVLYQSIPLTDYEIIIVNNDPKDNKVKEIVSSIQEDQFSGYPDLVKYLVCPIPGLSHSRNAGISEARGKVLCFLDDDAIAANDWVENICTAFAEHPQAGVIGGHIYLKPPEPTPKALKPGWEKYWSHFVTDNKDYTEVNNWWQFPWGANWSARRQALVEIGGFRTQYGRRKQNYSGGEEVIAASLIQKIGYKVAILPQAKVDHCVPEERFTQDHVKQTIITSALTQYQEQSELYIPLEITLLSNLITTARLFYQLILTLADPGTIGYRAREKYYLLIGRLILFPLIFRDFILRHHKPSINSVSFTKSL